MAPNNRLANLRWWSIMKKARQTATILNLRPLIRIIFWLITPFRFQSFSCSLPFSFALLGLSFAISFLIFATFLFALTIFFFSRLFPFAFLIALSGSALLVGTICCQMSTFIALKTSASLFVVTFSFLLTFPIFSFSVLIYWCNRFALQLIPCPQLALISQGRVHIGLKIFP